MSQLVHLPADADPDRIHAQLVADGAVILDGVLTPGEADAVRSELDPWVQATAPGRDRFTGFRTTRTGALAARSALCRDLIRDPRILAQCDRLLLPACERFQLHLGQVIRIMPGETAQSLHKDRWAWGAYLRDIEPQLNTIWALTDFTRENGATQVVPGSTAWPDDRRADPSEVTQAVMGRGSVLIYTGSVVHGGGANTSDADRVGLNITYALGWLRQEENQYLACPPEIARTFDPVLQDLLGYAMGSYALGYYSPPTAPGADPEVVPPNYVLGRRTEGSTLGSAADLAALNGDIRGG